MKKNESPVSRVWREPNDGVTFWTALRLSESDLDKKDTRSIDSAPLLDQITVPMRNLRFDFFDDSGLPRDSRVLMFYSFETEENLPRSGILHYHLGEGRFVGPRHDRELTSAALEFLTVNGRLVALAPKI